MPTFKGYRYEKGIDSDSGCGYEPVLRECGSTGGDDTVHRRTNGAHDAGREAGTTEPAALGRDLDGPCGGLQREPAGCRGQAGLHLQHPGCGEDSCLAEGGGGAEPSGHPHPLRHGCDPRLSDHLPAAAGHRQYLGHGGCQGSGAHSRRRGLSQRRGMDLQSDGGYRARCPLGTTSRGRRRGSVPGQSGGCGNGEGLPGRRVQSARYGHRHHGLREALRALRCSRGGARLQHSGYEPSAHVQSVLSSL